jgi:hypothetical protein
MADALSHKYLKTVQLSVYDGDVSASNRVEAYVMEFLYTEGGIDMELQLSSIRGLPSPPNMTISSAKQELRYLVHRLANHIGGFPELSRKQTPLSPFKDICQQKQLARLSICTLRITIPAHQHISLQVLSCVKTTDLSYEATRVHWWEQFIQDHIGKY